MGVHKRVLHIRKDNLVTLVKDWRSKDLADPFSTVGDLMENAGKSLPFWPSAFQLQNEDSEDHDVSFLGLKTWILQFTSLQVAFSWQSKQGMQTFQNQMKCSITEILTGNARYELSHVYRMLSGPYTKMLMITGL